MFKESDSWIVFVFGPMAFWLGLAIISSLLIVAEIFILLLAKDCKSWLGKICTALSGTGIIVLFIYRLLENKDNLAVFLFWGVGNMAYFLSGMMVLISTVYFFTEGKKGA